MSFETIFNPDTLDSLDDGDLRKACKMVLQRDIGPITDSTRELYKLAVKRALIGHPIAFEAIAESNPEISFDEEVDESISFAEVQTPSPTVSTPSPPRISPKFSSPPIQTRKSVSPNPYTPMKRSFPSPSSSALPPSRHSLIDKKPNRNHFLRNTIIVGIGAVLVGLMLAAVLSE